MAISDFIMNIAPVAPVLLLTAFGLIVLILGTIADRDPKGRMNHFMPPEYLSIAVMVPMVILTAAGLWSAVIRRYDGSAIESITWLQNMVTLDPFAMFMGLLAVVGTLVVMVMSLEYFGDHNTRNRAEYFGLLFFATTAILLVAAAKDLLMIYLSIEFLSLCSYVLAAYWKNDEKSSEAGIKYFLFGAVSSAVMLYGMSMLYGLTNSTGLIQIATALAENNVLSVPAAWTAVIMVIAGIGFKLALVPFHLWAPDTYEGAPTPITAWLSVASKAAGLAIAARFLLVAVPLQSGADWYSVIILLAALSMMLGNMVAITQRNIKRMLAYSSIAQVGYMMVGLVAAGASNSTTDNYGLAGLMIYAAAYLVMNLGIFSAVIAVERITGSSEIAAYAGLMKRAPFLASSMVVFFLSLAGIPPTAGFLGKFYVFAGAIQTMRTEMIVLAIIGVATSAISVYYYFNVVRLMFIHESDTTKPLMVSRPLMTSIVIMLVLTIGICLAAGPVINLARSAVL